MKTTHPLFPACLLAVGLLMQSCATTDELYARYECGKCTTRVLVASSSVSASSVSRLRWSPAVYFAFDAASLPAAERERLEANLDVQYLHAISPDAAIIDKAVGTQYYDQNEQLSSWIHDIWCAAVPVLEPSFDPLGEWGTLLFSRGTLEHLELLCKRPPVVISISWAVAEADRKVLAVGHRNDGARLSREGAVAADAKLAHEHAVEHAVERPQLRPAVI